MLQLYVRSWSSMALAGFYQTVAAARKQDRPVGGSTTRPDQPVAVLVFSRAQRAVCPAGWL